MDEFKVITKGDDGFSLYGIEIPKEQMESPEKLIFLNQLDEALYREGLGDAAINSDQRKEIGYALEDGLKECDYFFDRISLLEGIISDAKRIISNNGFASLIEDPRVANIDLSTREGINNAVSKAMPAFIEMQIETRRSDYKTELLATVCEQAIHMATIEAPATQARKKAYVSLICNIVKGYAPKRSEKTRDIEKINELRRKVRWYQTKRENAFSTQKLASIINKKWWG